MAVENCMGIWEKVGEEWDAGAELVDEECVGVERGEFGGEADLKDEVELSGYGAEDGEAREYGLGDEGVAPDADV